MRRAAARRGTRRSRYATRPRDTEYMLAVKRLPCAATFVGTPCGGVVEADHAGRRGLGQKAADDTCIPLCTNHHRERTDFSGGFKTWDKARMRAWLAERIEETRASMWVMGVVN